MGRLDDKVALITGGASGMGKVASHLFAREGAKVVLTDVADEAGGGCCSGNPRPGRARGVTPHPDGGAPNLPARSQRVRIEPLPAQKTKALRPHSTEAPWSTSR
jgi:NAD(P)-dependent dehydrogenase (short-subunit alcohol dehydrogenase family)